MLRVSGRLRTKTRWLAHIESGRPPPRLFDISVEDMEIPTNVRIAVITSRPQGDSTESIEPVLRRSARTLGEDQTSRAGLEGESHPRGEMKSARTKSGRASC